MKKDNRVFWSVLALATLVCTYFAFAQQISAQWVRYIGTTTNPVTPGQNGSYFNTNAPAAVHQVTAAGVDKTLLDTMQTAYDNQPASPSNIITESVANLGPVYTGYAGQTAPLMTWKLDNILDTYAGPIVTENATAANGVQQTQQPPGILMKGNTWDTIGSVSRPDWVRMTLNTFEAANNTFNFDIDHSLNGTTFQNVLTLIAQEHVPGGEETIMATKAYPGMCAGPTYPTGGLAFTCWSGNTVKFGPSLGSSQRITLGAGGLLPDNNHVVSLGQTFSNQQFANVDADVIRGVHDGVGTGAPDANYTFWSANFSSAANGAQQFSNAARLQGAGWNDLASSSVTTDVFLRSESVQVTGAAPDEQLAVYTSVQGSASNVLAGTWRTRQGTTGTLQSQHFSGTGTAPTFTPGGPITCGGGATVTAASGSSDTAGTIIITTGSAPCTGVFGALTVSFNKSYRVTPTVLVANANNNAATAQLYHHQPADNPTDFQINTVGTLTPLTEYRLSYIVVGNNDND